MTEETKLGLVEWLDDLCVRFIINLPQEELESVERICFQVEEAHWFYEDFVRPLDASLPSMSLRNFCLTIFKHCPLLSQFSQYHHTAAFSEFLAYKTRVPVRGAIMLNDTMDQVVLVKGYKKGSRWSFPRGKINKDEKDLDCAVREVYEETGFDIREAGLVGGEEDMKYIEVMMREQHMRLYVFRGVPMDTYFEPRTRKEISKIEWYKLSDLPTVKKEHQQQQNNGDEVLKTARFYMVAPFLGPLKKWIRQQRKKDTLMAANGKPAQGKKLKAAAAGGEETAEEEAYKTEDVTADEDAIPPAAPEPPPQGGDIERLLAGLRRSRAVSSDLPEVSEVSVTTKVDDDPAAALKRLLSVGGAPSRPGPEVYQQPPQPAAEEPNPLLAILRGQPKPANTSVRPPQTPFEQITVPPAEAPRSPHYHHNLPPLASRTNMPPPPLPHFPQQPEQQLPPQTPMERINPAQPPAPRSPHGQHHPRPPSFSQMPPPPSFGIGTSNGQPHSFAHGFQPGHPHPPLQAAFHMQGPMPQQQPFRNAPRPYQQTGDPYARQSINFPQQHGPIVPPASNLPLPKLNTHQLNLLNAFKTPGKPEVSEVSAESKNELPAQPTQPFGASALGPVEISPPNTKPTNAHQSGLLDLFRKSTVAGPNHFSEETNKEPVSAVEPVELSAQPTPSSSSTRRGQAGVPSAFQSPAGQNPPMKFAASLMPTQVMANRSRGPPTKSDFKTSATVSGPLNAPDFDTLKRSQMSHHHQHSAQHAQHLQQHQAKTFSGQPQTVPDYTSPTSAKPLAAAVSTSSTNAPIPTQILQRPTAGAVGGNVAPSTAAAAANAMRRSSAAATPPVPVHTVSPKTTLQAPRPFHPQQILRRPSHQISGSGWGSPSPTTQLVGQQQPEKPQQDAGLSARQANQQPKQPEAVRPFDRRSVANPEQKVALLELFNKPHAAAPARPPTSSGSNQQQQATSGSAKQATPTYKPATPRTHQSHVVSPVSPLPRGQAAQQQRERAQHERADHGQGVILINNRSRISSIDSQAAGEAGGEAAAAAADGSVLGGLVDIPAGGKAKVTAEPSEIGVARPLKEERPSSQSPVTPVDRTFLLGYLEGVVKGKRK
ncbi:hypothetical protein BDY21DRAFT_123802 [Lineolata rhizophorae]|uniref:Nudix hydrolase domain-containing protein n=1 Tax=Lineolata rhizophorae TaxID=578093 RepID=A0A6A6NQT8_9PEZI|nr:hypothetical protein BDY21DRAFT_123802 [Lineolata rhizophorae]